MLPIVQFPGFGNLFAVSQRGDNFCLHFGAALSRYWPSYLWYGVFVFAAIINECRGLLEGKVSLKRRKIKDLDERPEVNVAPNKSFPRRGTEKTQPYGSSFGSVTGPGDSRGSFQR
jgi:hypothetical protein